MTGAALPGAAAEAEAMAFSAAAPASVRPVEEGREGR